MGFMKENKEIFKNAPESAKLGISVLQRARPDMFVREKEKEEDKQNNVNNEQQPEKKAVAVAVEEEEKKKRPVLNPVGAERTRQRFLKGA